MFCLEDDIYMSEALTIAQKVRTDLLIELRGEQKGCVQEVHVLVDNKVVLSVTNNRGRVVGFLEGLAY